MTLERICLHWTAGNLKPNRKEWESYHFLVDDDLKVWRGKFPPEANGKQLKNTDKYAPHCGGGNSFTIGVAICGHPSAPNRIFTPAQLERTCKLIAEIAERYEIPIEENNIYTHYEFGLKHPNTASKGKPDINRLPFPVVVNGKERVLKANEIGDYLRNKVRWYANRV